MSKREGTTINVPVADETNQILEEIQQEWYGTSKKKGLVLDHIVQSYADENGLDTDTEEIHSHPLSDSEAKAADTHTLSPPESTQSETGWSEETLELAEQLEQDGCKVNPENWSDEAIEAASNRGASPFDPDDLVMAILRFHGESSRDAIKSAYRTAGYGKSTIPRYAREFEEWELTRVVDDAEEMLEEVAKAGIKQGRHRRRYKIHDNVADKDAKAREKYREDVGSSLEDALGHTLNIGASNILDVPGQLAVEEDVGVIVATVESCDFATYNVAKAIIQAYDDAGLLDDDLRDYIRDGWKDDHEVPV